MKSAIFSFLLCFLLTGISYSQPDLEEIELGAVSQQSMENPDLQQENTEAQSHHGPRNQSRIKKILLALALPLTQASLKTLMVQTNPLIHLGIAGIEHIESYAPHIDKAPKVASDMAGLIGEELDQQVEQVNQQTIKALHAGHELGYKTRHASNEVLIALVTYAAYSKTFGQHKHKQTALICGATTTLNRVSATLEFGEKATNGAIDAINELTGVAEQVCRGLDAVISALKEFGGDLAEAIIGELEKLRDKLEAVRDWFKNAYRVLDNAADRIKDELEGLLQGVLKVLCKGVISLNDRRIIGRAIPDNWADSCEDLGYRRALEGLSIDQSQNALNASLVEESLDTLFSELKQEIDTVSLEIDQLMHSLGPVPEAPDVSPGSIKTSSHGGRLLSEELIGQADYVDQSTDVEVSILKGFAQNAELDSLLLSELITNSTTQEKEQIESGTVAQRDQLEKLRTFLVQNANTLPFEGFEQDTPIDRHMRALADSVDFLRPATQAKIKAHLEFQRQRLLSSQQAAFDQKLNDATRHLLFADKCEIGNIEHVSFQKAIDFIDGLADPQLLADAWRDLFDLVLGDRIRESIGTVANEPFNDEMVRRRLEATKPNFSQVTDAFTQYVEEAFNNTDIESDILSYTKIAKDTLRYGSLGVPFSHSLVKSIGAPEILTRYLDYLPWFDPRFTINDGIGQVPHFVASGNSYAMETLRNVGDLLMSELNNPYAQTVALYFAVNWAYDAVSQESQEVDFNELSDKAEALDRQVNGLLDSWRSQVSTVIHEEANSINFKADSFSRIEEMTQDISDMLTDGFKKIGDIPVLGDIIKFLLEGCTAEDLVALYGLDDTGIDKLSILREELKGHYLSHTQGAYTLDSEFTLFAQSIEILQRAQETVFDHSENKAKFSTGTIIGSGLLVALLMKGMFRQKSLAFAQKLDVQPKPRGWRSKRAADRALRSEQRDYLWAKLNLMYHNMPQAKLTDQRESIEQ